MWHAKSQEKKLYLTFDDGPSPQITSATLQVLRSRNIKATFFCLGQNLIQYPQIAKEMISNGHVIANHTYSHYDGWQTDSNRYFEDVAKCHNTIKLYNQKEQRLFRPPYGRLKPQQYFRLSSQYQIVMWSLMVGDFDDRISKASCLERACKKTRSGDLVVFHDNEQSYEKLDYVLPRYLDYCLDNGYEFGLIPSCQH